MSGVGPIGNVIPGPIAPIPLNETIHMGTKLYDLASNWLSGGLTAGRLHTEMAGVDFDHLADIHSRLTSTHQYLSGLQTELDGILHDLTQAYDGQATPDMTTRFTNAKTSAENVSQKFHFLAGRFSATQDSLDSCAKAVGGYSRLGSDVSNVTSVFGGDSEDDKARDAWNKCKGDLGANGQSMSQVTQDMPGEPMTPTTLEPPAPTNMGTTIPGTPNLGSPGGESGRGSARLDPAPGQLTPPPPNPIHNPPVSPPQPPYPGGPGPGPVGPGPIGPGPIGPGPVYGPGPGHGPGPGYGGGGGVGLDSGSGLAGVGGGGSGIGGGGIGAGVGDGGLGAGDGGGSGLSGAGDAGTAGAGSGAGGGSGSGSGSGGGAGGRGVAGMPMHGQGGGGGNDQRERTTWLAEDEDVWGYGDDTDGVITS